jgi:hypothetical protein
MRHLLLQVITLVMSIIYLPKQIISQCNVGEIEVVVALTPDNFPSEISWDIKTSTGTVILAGTSNSTTACLPDNQCYTFTIYDSFGDGICCNYGIGSYSLSVDGTTLITGGEYTNSESTSFNCPPGSVCSNAIAISEGSYTAPISDTWYIFQPSLPGMYEISTCDIDNVCDTKIWIYETCNSLQWDNSNMGTLYYDDNNGGCGMQAVVTAALDPSDSYIIRIGSNNGVCGNSAIDFSITYTGPITGCMDPVSCNYNPLASADDGSCLYWPDADCPGGPDLIIVQSAFESSLYLDHLLAQNCQVQENCLTGYGNRTIIRFTTHIKNIGDVDYFIGNPTDNPSQFSFINCHNHSHYEGYAEYVLFRNNGNPIPIGFKNGFCVMDLECSDGGTAKYGCSNMGITAHCGDIYSSGLECQWIDITDVDPGDYIFAIRINWDQAVDALGRPELDYTNNWAQVCITITEDAAGEKDFVINPNCSDYNDCEGTAFGSTTIDCEGNCGGSRLSGDLNIDDVRDLSDATQYITEILNQSITAQPCTDLNNDGIISVWDAALVQECFYNGTPYNNACTYPHGVTSPNPTSYLEIQPVNFAQGYVDIHCQNPNNFIKGYEFNLSGITIQSVLPLYNTNNFTAIPQFNSTGKVIGLSSANDFLQKNTNPEPFLRVYFSAITGTDLCISDIIHFVNNDFYAIDIDTIGGCKQLQFANITAQNGQNFIIISPNPAKDVLNLQIGISTSEAILEITSITGQVLEKINVTKGTERVQMNINHLSSGVYFVKLKAENTEHHYKWIKE